MDPEQPPLPDKPVVVFDGVCNLCNAATQFVLDHDARGRLLLSASQSPSGAALLARFGAADRAGETFFLVEGGRLYDRSTAALRLLRLLGLPFSLAYVFMVVPRFLRDAVYGFVARRRYRWFGRRETCRVATPAEAARFLP